MVDSKLIKYLREGIDKGFSFLELRNNLLDQGWGDDEINSAWSQLRGSTKTAKSDSHIPRKFFIYGSLFVLFLFAVILFFTFNSPGVVFSEEDISEGKSFEVVRKPVRIVLDKGEMNISNHEIFSDHVRARINGKIRFFNLSQEISFDLDSDGIDDVVVRLEEIRAGVPRFYVSKPSLILEEEKEPLVEAESKNVSLEEEPLEEECVEDWGCSSWGSCVEGVRERDCSDSFHCGTYEDMPVLEEECGEDETIFSREDLDDACNEEYSGSEYYNDSFVCISEDTDSIFEVIYSDMEISCCKGSSVSSQQEACLAKEGNYFNSSYYCMSFITLDYDGEDIDCCLQTPVLLFEKTEEFNSSWDSLVSEGYCTQNFSEKIRACEPYKCNYVHPFDGIDYPLGVVLDDGSACNIYSEGMSDSYEYCKINFSFIGEYADYYANFSNETYLGDLEISFNTSESNPQNAKEIAYAQGDCQFVF